MPLWLQMCGRGARPHDVKLAFTIIDLGGNSITHGLWSSHRNWADIFHNPKKPSEGVAPVKTCPQCNALHHTAKKVCDAETLNAIFPCGYEFPQYVAKDSAIDEFILVSNSIDVKKLIEANAHYKEYRSLYVIIEQVFNNGVRIYKGFGPKVYDIICSKIYELARLWCKEKNRRFNEFHKKIVNQKIKELTEEQYKKQDPERYIEFTGY